MGRQQASLLLLTVAAASFATPALGRQEYVTQVSRPTYYSAAGLERSGLNDWGYRMGIDRGQNSYGAALQFARCATRMDSSAAERVLSASIAEPGNRQTLVRLVQQNRTCTGEISAVAPVLLRAALAETVLMSGRNGGDRPQASVGIPGIVRGFPLVAVARCQVANAPEKVATLLGTEPGAPSERAAAEALFAGTPECGTASGLGGIEPTVARLAVIEAAYPGK